MLGDGYHETLLGMQTESKRMPILSDGASSKWYGRTDIRQRTKSPLALDKSKLNEFPKLNGILKKDQVPQQKTLPVT